MAKATKKSTKDITEGLSLTTASKLDKAANGLVKVKNDIFADFDKAIEGATQELQDTVEAIVIKKAELADIDAKLVMATDEADYKLLKAIRASKEKVLNELATEFNKEITEAGTVGRLQSDKLTLGDEFKEFRDKTKATQDKVVAIAVGNATNKMKLEHAAYSAEDKAKINSLSSQVQSFKTQVEMLEKMIASEREARVQEAQARGNSMVTVNSTK